jgi:cytochrome c5
MQIRRCTTKPGRSKGPIFRLCGGLALLLSGAAMTAAADTGAAVDGQKIYDNSCAKCHDAGMGSFFTGAPRIGTEAWQTRLSTAGSVDALVAAASHGKGKMPAQGGSSGLSDAELKAAVEYILNKSSH